MKLSCTHFTSSHRQGEQFFLFFFTPSITRLLSLDEICYHHIYTNRLWSCPLQWMTPQFQVGLQVEGSLNSESEDQGFHFGSATDQWLVISHSLPNLKLTFHQNALS